MAILVNPFTCDVCKVLKLETNHWFLVFRNALLYSYGAANHSILLDSPGANESSDTVKAIVLLEWNEELARHPGVKHACGKPHALQLQGTESAKERTECI